MGKRIVSQPQAGANLDQNAGVQAPSGGLPQILRLCLTIAIFFFLN